MSIEPTPAPGDGSLSFDARFVAPVNFGPFSEDPGPPAGFVRMYHGTSESAALRIAESGFEPPRFGDYVQEAAGASGIPEEAVRRRLEEYGSFLVVRDGYSDQSAYVADSPLWAEGWGRSGGEARAEAFGAAYAILEQRDGIINDRNRRLSFMESHVPVVIAIDVAVSALHRGDRPVSLEAVYERRRQLLGQEPDQSITGRCFARVADCSFEPSSTNWSIVSIRPVERVWEDGDIAHHLGLRLDHFTRGVDEGLYPQPDDYPGRPLWWQSTVAEWVG